MTPGKIFEPFLSQYTSNGLEPMTLASRRTNSPTDARVSSIVLEKLGGTAPDLWSLRSVTIKSLLHYLTIIDSLIKIIYQNYINIPSTTRLAELFAEPTAFSAFTEKTPESSR